MSAVYLVVLSVLFLNFYRQSYHMNKVTTPVKSALVIEEVKAPAKPAPQPAPVLEQEVEKVEKTGSGGISEYRVGTFNHFVRAMLSHGFGCFIKED